MPTTAHRWAVRHRPVNTPPTADRPPENSQYLSKYLVTLPLEIKRKAIAALKRFRRPGIARVIGLHIHAVFPFFVPIVKSLFTLRPIRGLVLDGLDWYKYNSLLSAADREFPVLWINNYPCLEDRFSSAGHIPKHYFIQDIWAARKVAKSGVALHFDIGSRVDGFIAHCLTVCNVVMLDVRPLDVEIEGLSFRQTDCTNMSDFADGSVSSISSLHAIEHFGLGRYGDPIDPFGWKRVLLEIARILATGGRGYISVPVGFERVEFNGGRVFDPLRIVDVMTMSNLRLIEFSLIDDDDKLRCNVSLEEGRNQMYGCGLFHFEKH